ncbi:alpha/beta fold hydrolase [Methylomonas paludis]|uniref:Alpha/beta fold hydrolase n=1 Tax=Methylomonas paludis TaxID=1173101 RepID=A0A975MP61_9GAMM|nr:alpha/beta fold hydrolase [Methylomonas paludis]QWF71422.1 alpha/beta fold hydrolase [Methylomonas paludis]
MQAIALAFESFGESQSGTPLLILHGFFASARNWRSIAKQLAQQRQVFVLDMRNHGSSDHHVHMDYPAMAEDVRLFMDNQQIDTADIIGHSMGGKIAMWFALHYPQRLGKLIVVDISPVSYQHSFATTVAALKNLPLHELGNRKQAEQHLAALIPDLNYRQFLLQNLVFEAGQYSWRVNLDFFADNAANIVAFPAQLSAQIYPLPVLFLAGENSFYIRPDSIYQRFPNAEIKEIPGAGHWLHVDAPALFLQLVSAWLA